MDRRSGRARRLARVLLAPAFLVGTSALLLPTTPSTASPSQPPTTARALAEPKGGVADFNGDGYSDLVAGFRLAPDAAVAVIYGSAKGLSTAKAQIWSQNSSGIAGTAETGDRFGASLAPGNFNGDAYADLAIGVPGESLGSVPRAGAVQILYGSRSGLRAAGDRFLTQDTAGVWETAEIDDGFGSSIAAGDFGHGSATDLAISAPNEGFAGIGRAGVVHVLYGAAGGLDPKVNQIWSQNTPGVLDDPEGGDNFGEQLVSGDFGRDGRRDLAIGIRQEDVGDSCCIEHLNTGEVQVLFGSSTGLAVAGNQAFDLTTAGMLGERKGQDHFGAVLAAGNLGRGSRDDLVVATVPSPASTRPALHVLYGTAAGLGTAGNQLLDPVRPGQVDDQASQIVLAVGNVGRTGEADLAVGLPGASVGTGCPDEPCQFAAGVVNVWYGSSTGTTSTGQQSWSQDSSGVGGVAETLDTFGTCLAIGNFGRDASGARHGDLAVGVPGEDIEAGQPVPFTDNGSLTTLYGTAGGLTSTASSGFDQSALGQPRRAGSGFGCALAASGR